MSDAHQPPEPVERPTEGPPKPVNPAQSVTTPEEQRARRHEERFGHVGALPDAPLPPLSSRAETGKRVMDSLLEAGNSDDEDKARARAAQMGLPLWIDVDHPTVGQRAVAGNGVVGAFESPGPGKPLVFMVDGPTFDAEVARLQAAGLPREAAEGAARLTREAAREMMPALPDDLLERMHARLNAIGLSMGPQGGVGYTPMEMSHIRRMAEDGNEGARAVLESLVDERRDLRVVSMPPPPDPKYPSNFWPFYTEPDWPSNGREAGAWAAGVVTGLARRDGLYATLRASILPDGPEPEPVDALVEFKAGHIEGASVTLVAAGVTVAPHKGTTLHLRVPINKGQGA